MTKHTNQLDKATEPGSELKEYDFVAIVNWRAYRVRRLDSGGDYWVCRLHPDKWWVTHRKVTNQSEFWALENMCTDWEYAHLYEFGLPFEESKWPPRKNKSRNVGDRLDV